MATLPQNSEFSETPCSFCYSAENNELELGCKKSLANVVCHYYCLLLSSKIEQKGEDNEGILGFMLPDIKKELARGKRQKCIYCVQPGATIRCVLPRCRKIFHLPCGIKHGSLHQFHGHFKSFCGQHRPVQKIPPNLLSEISDGSPTCAICMEDVPKAPGPDTVWAPCCRKGAWFHRQCVQKLAISAGYFFKCPLCNNKDKFRKAMLACGIFIPKQDASWEMVPNAFEELLHRHNQCDQPKCRNPVGRHSDVKGTLWEIVLCTLCGSQGTHIECGELSWDNPLFECPVCLGSQAQAIETNYAAENSADSISLIGKDTPFPVRIESPSPDRGPSPTTDSQSSFISMDDEPPNPSISQCFSSQPNSQWVGTPTASVENVIQIPVAPASVRSAPSQLQGQCRICCRCPQHETPPVFFRQIIHASVLSDDDDDEDDDDDYDDDDEDDDDDYDDDDDDGDEEDEDDEDHDNVDDLW